MRNSDDDVDAFTPSITGLNINTPLHTFSIDGANGLALDHITIDNSAGDTNSLGHNTDAFDVGDSTGVTISGARVKNQDDCLAINSGTVSNSSDPCQQCH